MRDAVAVVQGDLATSLADLAVCEHTLSAQAGPAGDPDARMLATTSVALLKVRALRQRVQLTQAADVAGAELGCGGRAGLHAGLAWSAHASVPALQPATLQDCGDPLRYGVARAGFLAGYLVVCLQVLLAREERLQHDCTRAIAARAARARRDGIRGVDAAAAAVSAQLPGVGCVGRACMGGAASRWGSVRTHAKPHAHRVAGAAIMTAPALACVTAGPPPVSPVSAWLAPLPEQPLPPAPAPSASGRRAGRGACAHGPGPRAGGGKRQGAGQQGGLAGMLQGWAAGARWQLGSRRLCPALCLDGSSGWRQRALATEAHPPLLPPSSVLPALPTPFPPPSRPACRPSRLFSSRAWPRPLATPHQTLRCVAGEGRALAGAERRPSAPALALSPAARRWCWLRGLGGRMPGAPLPGPCPCLV